LADYLVRRGIPFRSAHEAVGRLVYYCTQRGLMLEELSPEELARESGLPQFSFGPEVYDAIKLEQCVLARATYGGPSPEAVKEGLQRARERLEGVKDRLGIE
ncbi:MAG: argininosuccinate lyase, partial [Syntrophomonadaceae bacterium]|nr:argininosuccinate lyase [Syntrophomonadaceae bacterium]